MTNKKTTLIYAGLALALIFLAAELYQRSRREMVVSKIDSVPRSPSSDSIGPGHGADSQQGGSARGEGVEGGVDDRAAAGDAQEGTAPASDGETAGSLRDAGLRSAGALEDPEALPSGTAAPPEQPRTEPHESPASEDAAGKNARKSAEPKPGLRKTQAAVGELMDPALLALKASLKKALAAAGSAELKRLGKLLDGPDPAGGILRVQRALALVNRMDAIGGQVSRLDEEFNLKRIELQADRQARGGRAGALRRELAEMERGLRGKTSEQAGLRKEFESIAGKTPPPDPAQSRMPFDLPVSGAARTAVQTAYAQLGKPYVWGADGTRSYDCSGLVMHAWDRAGVDMLHSSRMQSRTFPTVPRNALAPGDLLYFYNPVHHVAMYVGEGKMIHAPATGDVVRVAPVNWKNFVWANRPQPKPKR